MFARIATAISGAGGDMGAVDIVGVEKSKIIRDITVNARDEEHEQAIVQGHLDRARRKGTQVHGPHVHGP